jgi:hypothetical protein
VFSLLVGVAFSLWRAAFLAEMPTRKWPQALGDAQQILKTVLSTNTIAFTTEHKHQGVDGRLLPDQREAAAARRDASPAIAVSRRMPMWCGWTASR